MNTIKCIKNRIFKELSKLRAGLDYLRYNFEIEPEIHPNIIIHWGEVIDQAGGVIGDGSCIWHKFYKYIVNVGIPSVTFGVRQADSEELLESLRHKLRVVNSLIRQFLEHVESLEPTERCNIGGASRAEKRSWNLT